MQSGIDLETLVTIRLLRDPVCHAGEWEGVRPWPRPLPASRGPHARRRSRQGKKYIAVDGWCLITRKGLRNQPHDVQIAERPQLRSHYPRVQRRHQTGLCSIIAIRTNSKTISAPGAKMYSVPVSADTTKRNSRLKSEKRVPLGTQNYAISCIPRPSPRGQSGRLAAVGGE